MLKLPADSTNRRNAELEDSAAVPDSVTTVLPRRKEKIATPDGTILFYPDVYGHDRQLLEALRGVTDVP